VDARASPRRGARQRRRTRRKRSRRARASGPVISFCLFVAGCKGASDVSSAARQSASPRRAAIFVQAGRKVRPCGQRKGRFPKQPMWGKASCLAAPGTVAQVPLGYRWHPTGCQRHFQPARRRDIIPCYPSRHPPRRGKACSALALSASPASPIETPHKEDTRSTTWRT